MTFASNDLRRAIVLGAGVIVSGLCVGWFSSGKSHVGEQPNFRLEQIPLQLDTWVGKEVPIPDETLRVLNASDYINREYENPSGQRITLHIAIWVNDETVAAAPHPPGICFPAAGWTQLRSKMTTSSAHPIELIEFKKSQRTAVTAHWYSLGPISFTDEAGFTKQRFRLRGAKNWPYTVKVMLKSDLPKIELASSQLEAFSELITNSLEQLSLRAEG